MSLCLPIPAGAALRRASDRPEATVAGQAHARSSRDGATRAGTAVPPPAAVPATLFPPLPGARTENIVGAARPARATGITTHDGTVIIVDPELGTIAAGSRGAALAELDRRRAG